MDDKGEIVSAYDVDENIVLQIWTKGLSPRLVVLNKNQNTRKLIRLNWLERLDRKLFVKGKKRGESVEYSLADLLTPIRRILSEYAVYTSFKPRLWKFAMALERVLHTPAVVSEKGELALLPEEKRSCLWIADLTSGPKGEGCFRPFFPLLDEDKEALPERLPIVDNRRGVEDLFKTGVVRKLASQSPSRWYRPIHIMAAAMLLSFSFCEEDGSDFADEFWQGGKTDNERKNENVFCVSRIDDPRLMGLGRKFVSFARHFGAVGKIAMRISLDSDEELQDEGYARKRRIEFPVGLLGDVEYSVTFFDRDDGTTALGCKPKGATLRHKGELVYTLPTAAYELALDCDAFGGSPDDYFTVVQLMAAKEFEGWSNNVLPYVSAFTGGL